MFAPVIADAEYERLREEVRWFTAQLGESRNLDVMLKRLGDAHDAHALRTLLTAERDRSYEEMLAAFGSERLRLLTFDIVAWLETGKWRTRKRAAKPLGDFASNALGKRWKKIERNAGSLTLDDPEAQHRLRIEVKKLRYAAEFLTSLVSDGKTQRQQKAFLGSLETMQQELGELNDRVTARETLDRLLASRRDAASLSTAAERLTASGDASRRSLHEAEKAAGRLLAAGPYWL